MKQEEIKCVYEIESSLDLYDVIDSLQEELGLKEGVLVYFSLSADDLLEEKLPIDNLKKRAMEVNSDEEYPALIFPDVEISVDEGKIEVKIFSKIKLELKGVDVERVIEK